jgi:hypothetical protein
MKTWTCTRCGHPYLEGIGCECLPKEELRFTVESVTADFPSNKPAAERFARFLNSRAIFACQIPREFLKV